MKASTLAGLAGALILFSTPAVASSLDSCTDAPQAEWKSVDEIKGMAAAAGYEVRKVETEGSCYEVYGVSAEGKLFELYYNPATGEVVKTEEKS